MDGAQLLGRLYMPKTNQQLKRLGEFLDDCLSDCPKLFSDQVERTVKGGKRLRPLMVMLAAETGRDSNKTDVLKAAAAVELTHKASLLHDAISDDELTGQQAAISVLAGDYLLAKAMWLAGAVSAEAIQELADCVIKMVEGETIQAMPGYQLDPDSDSYIDCVAKKTASLFAGSCLIGGRLGNLVPSDLNKLKNYGYFFGIAFQIIDDLSDDEFSKTRRPAAKAAAKDYMDRAKQEITSIKDSPAKKTLLKVADVYLSANLS